MRLFFSSFGIAVGAAVAVAAIPVAVSDLLALPGDSVFSRLQEEQAVGAPELRGFVRSREAAAQWRATSGIHKDIALGRLILGEFLDPPGRARNLAETEISLTKGLGLAPMDPYGWMRLAQVRSARGAPVSEIAAPLRLALRSGPHEDRRHAMLLLTVETGLAAWEELDDAERGLIGQKARMAWSRDARGTAGAAVRAGRSDVLAGLLGL